MQQQKIMEDYFIPIKIQALLQNNTDMLIRDLFPEASWRIIAIARGKFIYLRRYLQDGTIQNLSRLTYSGELNNMPFALYNYSTEKYESTADFIGAHHLNGTLEGALKAILEAFPLHKPASPTGMIISSYRPRYCTNF